MSAISEESCCRPFSIFTSIGNVWLIFELLESARTIPRVSTLIIWHLYINFAEDFFEVKMGVSYSSVLLERLISSSGQKRNMFMVMMMSSVTSLTSVPNVKLTPRSFSPHPAVSLSGSDHNRSQSRPWSGTSVGLMIRRICSIACKSGDKPPWQQNIFSSTVTIREEIKNLNSTM